MSAELGLVATFVLFFLFLGLGMAVPWALLIPAMFYLVMLDGLNAFKALGIVSWANMNSFTLTAVPLFILMAEILEGGGLITRVFRGLSHLMRRVPGGLLQTNIAGCAVFAAVSGSSITTAAAIGAAALPQLHERGYDPRLATGSLAAGGTLGILIPPSLAMIIYASFTEASVARLFMAGLIPGLLMTGMFMAYIAYRAWRDPAVAPREAAGGTVSAREALADMVPLAILVVIVIGSMYMGIATPTEAAALGCAIAFVLSAIFGRLALRDMIDCLKRTVLVSGSILFLVFSAYVFSHALSFGGVGGKITQFVVGMDLERWQFILILFAFYTVLGCVIESLGMIVLTVPIVYPMLGPYDIDVVWFGVLLVVFIEMSQVTPPTGLNLYVINGLNKGGAFADVVLGALPFFLIMLLLAATLVIWPELALWLPAQM